MRHGQLIEQFERASGEQAVRVALVHAPRGMGRTHTVRAFAEEMGGRGIQVDVVGAETCGAVPGGCIDALLRKRLGLAADAPVAAVLEVLDAQTEGVDPLAREFLAFVLGADTPDFQTARLDAAARWEGAIAEVARWLSANGRAWIWVLDDGSFVDAQTLQLLELLGQSTGTPALVVLTVREEAVAAVESRLKPLRAIDRLTKVSLPLPALDNLRRDFDAAAVTAARGVPLTAALLSQLGTVLPGATIDSAVREVVSRLSDLERVTLDLVCVANGRLPESALEAVLGGAPSGVGAALAKLRLCQRGVTRRFPGSAELFVRFPVLVAERQASVGAKAAGWLTSLGMWAEHALLRPDTRPEQLALVLPLVVRAAEAAGDVDRASLALELWHRHGGGLEVLQRAIASARGSRRLVLARRYLDELVFRGEVAQAANEASTALRVIPGAAVQIPPGWPALLFSGVEDELERWDELSQEEAVVSVELARAEALAQLGRAMDTRAAFETLETKLERLPATRGAAALWLKTARTWSWFHAEMLADGLKAREVCERVRQQVDPEFMASSYQAVGFLRAEQIAHSRGGDPARAEALADELIWLSRQRGSMKDECVAWNARALLHLRTGELSLARSGFERSLDLARRVGFRRREAIALHNLGLTLGYLGEYGASVACQEKYQALSERIGNFVARAYAPAAIAQVLVQTLDSARAEEALASARRAAEENGWPGLVAWARHLSGLLKLFRHCEKRDTLQLSLARADFMACLDVLEDRKAAWSEELAPAEAASCLALAWLLAGNAAQAKSQLVKAERFAKESAASGHFVDALRDVVEGREPTAALAWFEEHGHVRTLHLWQRVMPAIHAERRRAERALASR